MLTIEEARVWYPENDPVHGLDHIERVYKLAEHIAHYEGGDIEILRAAVLLHDAHDAENEENRLNHHLASAEFAHQILTNEGWSAERVAAVKHCIRAHRFRDDREQPRTLEAKILFDADKLDAIGAVGVVRSIAYAVQARQNLYAQPSVTFLRNGIKDQGEAHTPHHEFMLKLRNLKSRLYTPTARTLAEERHDFMKEFFNRLDYELRGEHIELEGRS